MAAATFRCMRNLLKSSHYDTAYKTYAPLISHQKTSCQQRLVTHIRCYSSKPSSKFATRGKKTLLLCFVVCGTTSVGFELYNRYLNYGRKQRIQASTSINEQYDIPAKLDVDVSRQVIGPNEEYASLGIQLFQYQTCPFCCKVRAYLDYYGLSYNVIEVNPVLRKQISFSKYKKVPIVIYNHQSESRQLNDSSLIVSVLSSFMSNERYEKIEDVLKYYPPVTFKHHATNKVVTEAMNKYYIMYGEEQLSKDEMDAVAEERKWRMWVDDWLVHLLSPNIYCSRQEAMQAFNYFSQVGEWEKNFSAWERYLVIYVGAFAMYFIGKRLKKKYGLKEDVRESLYDACREWTRAIGRHRNFMGGDKPNLADLAVYGVLNSIEGCIAFDDLLANTKIKSWYFRTKKAVTSHAGATNQS